MYEFVGRTHELIAQRGRNLSCEYFYRSLGCQELTSSSCDVRVHFRVARQSTSSANANAVEHYHVLFKNVFTSAFYRENLAFPKICVHL